MHNLEDAHGLQFDDIIAKNPGRNSALGDMSTVSRMSHRQGQGDGNGKKIIRFQATFTISRTTFAFFSPSEEWEERFEVFRIFLFLQIDKNNRNVITLVNMRFPA